MDQLILIDFLDKLLGRSKSFSNSEQAFHCPFCKHHKQKLQVNLNTFKWHCWVCSERGHNLFQLLKKLKLPKDLYSQLEDIVGSSKSYKSRNYKDGETKKQSISLPIDFIPLYHPSKSPLYKHAMLYLKKRNISSRDILKYNIGYCEDGEYRNRIIIPSYDKDGSLNYFIGRDFFHSKLKYKNPRVSKDVIGFELFVNWNLPIVLCEGVFDAIAIKRNAIPLFGKTIPNSLMIKIITKNVKTVYISLDNDAINDSLKMAEKLKNNGIDIYFINLPDNEDPSSIGFSSFMEFMDNSSSLTFKDMMKYKLWQI